MKVDPEKTVKCNDCHYSQLTARFNDQDEINKHKELYNGYNKMG
jgi:hypothetical protein